MDMMSPSSFTQTWILVVLGDDVTILMETDGMGTTHTRDSLWTNSHRICTALYVGLRENGGGGKEKLPPTHLVV